MPTSFSEQTHQLAQALVATFPDLRFTTDPNAGTLTILAGGLRLVVAPAPAPAAPLEGLAENGLAAVRRNVAPGFAARFAAQPVGGLSEVDYQLLGMASANAQGFVGDGPAADRAAADLKARYAAEMQEREATGRERPDYERAR